MNCLAHANWHGPYFNVVPRRWERPRSRREETGGRVLLWFVFVFVPVDTVCVLIPTTDSIVDRPVTMSSVPLSTISVLTVRDHKGSFSRRPLPVAGLIDVRSFPVSELASFFRRFICSKRPNGDASGFGGDTSWGHRKIPVYVIYITGQINTTLHVKSRAYQSQC